ncbi:MAG: hypothetical protein ACREMW_03335 [Gemmatimonadales bacterium]
MPNYLLGPGLYVVERYSPEKGVKHIAFLDVANQSGVSGWGHWNARLLELSAAGLRFDPYNPSEGWSLVRRVADESAAIRRIHQVLTGPTRPYDAVFNNCEHLVSYIETGIRTSPQIRNMAIAAGIVVGVVALAAAAQRAA